MHKAIPRLRGRYPAHALIRVFQILIIILAQIAMPFASLSRAYAAAPVVVQVNPGGDPSGDGVSPIYIAGNPNCATLNADELNYPGVTADYGFKVNKSPNGTFTLTSSSGELTGGAPSDPSNSVTISNSDNYSFNWSSTLGVDAVIVKGGNNSDAFVYMLEDTSDTQLHAPVNANNGKLFEISHIEFCYDYDVSQPALTLDKTASPTTYATPGQQIVYTYTIENSGDTPVSGPFTVNDDQLGQFSCPAGSLAPGESIICTANYAITQEDLDTGAITNVASVTNGSVTSNDDDATITADQDPRLALSKLANSTEYDTLGAPISYSYTLENTGNVTLSGPFTVDDDKIGTIACGSASSLAPGLTLSCDASYTITQDDLDAGKVLNIARGYAQFDGQPVGSNQAQQTVYAVSQTGLNLTKQAEPAIYNAPGQSILYIYTIKNTGNQTLPGPFSVDDDKLGTISCSLTSLAPDATVSCEATHTITQDDLNAGEIINKATASNGKVTSNEATATVGAEQSVDLSLAKYTTTASYDAVGNEMSYFYELTNQGNVTLSGPFMVADDKIVTPNSVTCPPTSSLLPGQSITCHATYTVTQADLDAGKLVNTAVGHGFFGDSPVESNKDSATVDADQNFELTLVKTAKTAGYAAAGETISYGYTVENSGNVTLAGPFSIDDDKIVAPNSASCPATASLAPGEAITCTATYTVSQADVDAGAVTNIASASNGSVTSNSDDATVYADQNPRLSLAKQADPQTYDAVGDTIDYTYTLENSGNVTLSGPFAVADDKIAAPAGVSCDQPASLAPGATLSCTASYPIRQDELDAGQVKNVATGHAFFGNEPIESEPAEQTVYAESITGLTLTKQASPTTYDAVDQVITYRYTIENTGNQTLAGPFTVEDDQLGALSCFAGSLAPNSPRTCEATYTITQEDLDAGAITNKATASNGSIASNEATATVSAAQDLRLGLVKTATTAGYDAEGDTISYEYELTNLGNVTLSDEIAVIDDKITDGNSVVCPPNSGLAPGKSIICNATYTVTQDDLDNGEVKNIAIGYTSFGDQIIDTNPASATVPAEQHPGLSLDKSAADGEFTAAGQEISYEYLVTNSGNLTLYGPFTVTDDKIVAPSSATCPDVDSLAPGDAITCHASYAISQADVDAGKVTNVAYASSGNLNSNKDTVTVEIAQHPALSLDKSTTSLGYSAVGDTISYSYKLTNQGNVTLSGPFTVADDKIVAPNGVICPPQLSLAPGASTSCDATYRVTQADLDAGKLVNTATGQASFGDAPVVSDKDSVTINARQNPALTLTKEATTAGYAAAGETISYAYTVENSGNVTLAGPFSIDDDKIVAPNSASCPATASLAPGEAITCMATYTVSQADVDAGAVTNVASASNGSVTSNNDDATVYADQSPGLSLTKQADPQTYDAVGDTIDYTYTLENSGNVTLSGPFTIIDDKIAPPNSVVCEQPASLAPDATVRCTASYSITQADLDAGEVRNKARGQVRFGTAPVDSNKAEQTVYAVSLSGLNLTKQADPAIYTALGQVITYRYTIENTGNQTLAGPFTVDDDKLGLLSCFAGSLAPNSPVTCEASHTITQDDLDAGAITNLATASNGSVASNEATATVSAAQDPRLGLVKTATTAGYDAEGDTISYEYELTNLGNVTLSGPFTVSDDKIGPISCFDGSLEPGDSISCAATYTVSQDDLDNGEVINIASASATFDGAPVESNSDKETVAAEQSPAITLLKTADLTSYSVVGELASYSYTIKNIGNVTLPGPFSVTDDKIGTFECSAESLAPGAELGCTASYTITQEDINAGELTNHAQATTQFANQDINSNLASLTIPAAPIPALTLGKTASPTTYSAVGQVIVYTYMVTNTGNVNVDGPFTITDDKLGSFQCGPATSLAPGATISCAQSYTIQASDLGNVPGLPNQAQALVDYGSWSDEGLSYVKVTLDKTAAGSGISDGVYAGWCIQYQVEGQMYEQRGTVYSSTDPNMPADAASLPWNKINYVLNHKIRGAGKDDTAFMKDVQTAIWLLLGEKNTEFGVSREARQMVSAANANPNYVPGKGDIVAAIVYSDGLSNKKTRSIQEVIIELKPYQRITNLATASGRSITSDEATATVTQVAATAKLTPTDTTCSIFANNAAGDLSRLQYLVNAKSKQITSVAPGVLFYYSQVKAPSTDFSIQVVQSNPNAFPALDVQQQSNKPQVILYTASCDKSKGQEPATISVDPQTQSQTMTLHVSGATAGATYYISVKYSSKPIVKLAVSQPYPTVPYTFVTRVGNSPILSSQDSLEVSPK